MKNKITKIWPVLALMFLVSILGACKGGQKVQEPKEEPVIFYDVSIGPEGQLVMHKTAPSLRIYADGKVLVGDPNGHARNDGAKDHVSLKAAIISPKEVRELVNFIMVENSFGDLDADDIEEKVKAAGYDQIADGSMYEIQVNDSKLGSHKVRMYALYVDKPAKSEIPEMQKLMNIGHRLHKFRQEMIKK